MTTPLVSIITPTYKREQCLGLIYSCVKNQDWPNLEWLVDDDSPEASPLLKGLSDPRVNYYHNPSRRSLGAKRNNLVQRSSGQFIVHFDDDDFYASHYVSHHILSIVEKHADCSKLFGFFVYSQADKQFFYWDQMQSEGAHIMCMPDRPRRTLTITDNRHHIRFRLGYGFSFAYRRCMWDTIKFPDINFCEDLSFMAKAANTYSVIMLRDTAGLCLHVIHSASSSGCFPQYTIPSFMLKTIFPRALAYYSECG